MVDVPFVGLKHPVNVNNKQSIAKKAGIRIFLLFGIIRRTENGERRTENGERRTFVKRVLDSPVLSILLFTCKDISPFINYSPGKVSAKIHRRENNISHILKKSKFKIALELIEWAIEEREDMHFSKIAEVREKSGPKWKKDSDKIWK